MESINKKQKIRQYIIPSIVIIAAIIFSIVTINISSERQLTSLESSLFQFIILGLSLTGSFYIGKISAKNTAIEIIKPHARSAFRRLLALYNSLGSVAELVRNNNKSMEIKLEKIDSVVIEQINTADDALEDWKDIIPDEIEDIVNKFKNNER